MCISFFGGGGAPYYIVYNYERKGDKYIMTPITKPDEDLRPQIEFLIKDQNTLVLIGVDTEYKKLDCLN
jgi:hypothetical protein